MPLSASAAPYDVILIGSGMGALTTASLLAQVGRKRVLLLERHFKPGGFTHSFRRDKYEWDVGVHYVGQMQTGSMTRRFMDLVTRGEVQWHAMGPVYDRLFFPAESFDIPIGKKSFCDKLIQRFPEERATLIRYFQDIRRAQGWMARWFVSKQQPTAIARLLTLLGRRLATMTTGDYMQRFQDPLLKAILTGQWPDFGTPPDRSAFGFHAVVTADYFNGGFYPIGGAKQIATAALKAVEAAGGTCLVNHIVKEIVIRNGRAVGVKGVHHDKEFEYTAPIIVSNAGAATTFRKLVGGEHASRERERVSRSERGPSASILFLGLNDDPRYHNFTDANYWIFDQTDHRLPDATATSPGEAIQIAFLSFGSLRNPGQTPHTAQIIALDRNQTWQRYGDSVWKRRGEQYESHKQAMAQQILQFVTSRFPRLAGLVDFSELSTPLTIESFTGHPMGMIYGQECSRARLEEDAWPIATSVRGLFLTGSDVGTPGINGALMAGVMTAGKLLGPLGMPRIFTQAKNRSFASLG